VKLDEKVRRTRLKHMLEQVAGSVGIERVREDLQSKAVPAAGEAFDVPSSDETFATESLDAFVSRGIESIHMEQRDALEAIVHRRYRPALYVNNDSYKPAPRPGTSCWKATHACVSSGR
jgi:predicted methyltransferase